MNPSFGRLPGVLLVPALLCLPPPPTVAAAAAATAAPGPPAVWPLSPRPEVVRGFEQPAKPWLSGHRGVDLAGKPGQPVLSATAGKITYAGQLAGRGVVVVSNGPTRTTYEPVVPAIQLGATVSPGTQLGRLSAAASHCAPAACLHWGLRQSTLYLNPLSLLRSRTVRLLPTADLPTTPLSHPDTAAGTSDTGFSATSPSAAERALLAPSSGLPSPALPRPGPRAQVAPEPAPEPGSEGQISAGDNAIQLADRQSGSPAAPIVVGLAALITIGSTLLIRRH
ncbi:hypothetical protein GCM10009744_04770 [Kribbella alba]|uniref:M23ase beta-sheet core domain-containing protein n=1 Tax=Kribbella alba TaxID=190197 RepID=A0ABN2EXK5_9ACTN